MFETLPKTSREFMSWQWDQIGPYIQDLLAREINIETIEQWLRDWTKLEELLNERRSRLYVATAVDTTDKEAEQQLLNYLDHIYPKTAAARHALNVKLVSSGIIPVGFEIPVRNIKAYIETYRDENLPLLTELQKLTQEYDKIVGAQTVEWNGEERTIAQVTPVYQDADRAIREHAWRLAAQRQLQDREALNTLWVKLLKLRKQIAKNAGFENFRDYQWKQMGRFDYTPEDCYTFHKAIEEVVVPAAERIYMKRRQQLGVQTLRPWDLQVDPHGKPALRPFKEIEELQSKCIAIFNQIDNELGHYFQTMYQEKLLDLDNRKGKAPGGFCTSYDVERVPFIFMNAVGLHDDVQTMLHEAGHAFHVFEARHWTYSHQLDVPTEFAEVASMSMELLAAPYLSETQGGFYTEEDTARARIEHLEGIITFWPYMAVVDAFQQWVYTNDDSALDPTQCDAKWGELWRRFMRGVDWSGLEDIQITGWQRKLHIFQIPFYYVEYGLAQLGAVQVWNQSLQNQQTALEAYRKALALGGTVSLPTLYATAGANFAFDVATLQSAVSLVETTIVNLS